MSARRYSIKFVDTYGIYTRGFPFNFKIIQKFLLQISPEVNLFQIENGKMAQIHNKSSLVNSVFTLVIAIIPHKLIKIHHKIPYPQLIPLADSINSIPIIHKHVFRLFVLFSFEFIGYIRDNMYEMLSLE